MRAVWQLLLVLGLCSLAPGCALPSSSRAGLMAAEDPFSTSPTLALAGLSARDSLYATDGIAARGGLEDVRHGHDALVALYILAGFVIIFVVFVDLFLLPFSYRRRRFFFPCCRYVIRRCH